ncbi:MAG: FtsX-like permease family protein [Myxococcota bacterium]
MLLRLAVLNLTRSVRRSVLSMSSVVLGVAVIIVGQGVIAGFEENSIRAAVDGLTGHVQIRPRDYPTEGLAHPIDKLAPVDPALADWLDANTSAWTARTVFVAEAVHGADAMPVRAIGVDPAKDSEVFPRSGWTIDGSEPVSAEDGVLLSTGVARLLELKAGDTVVLQAHTTGGAMNALEVPVAGVFNAGTPMLDRFGVVLARDLARDLLQSGDRTSHVSVRLDDREQTEAFAARLTERLPEDREIVTWIDECAPVLAFQAVRQAALNLVVLALMGMSATGIANTVLMAAYERVREIGTLRAMGMTRAGVMQLFVLEGALLGVVGGSLGALLGAAVVLWFEDRGIELPLALATGHLPVSTILYLRFSLAVAAFSALFGLTTAVLASVYPAVVASRPAPAEAVRA